MSDDTPPPPQPRLTGPLETHVGKPDQLRPSVGTLMLALAGSLLYAGVLAFFAGFVVGTVEVWLRFSGAIGVVWLVFAALQIVWWRRGYEKFWRPIYPVTLSSILAFLFLPLLLLLWPRFRRWLFASMKPHDGDRPGARDTQSLLDDLGLGGPWVPPGDGG